MAGSVLDNTTYRCVYCGQVVDQKTAQFKPCPNCGQREYSQIATTEVCDFCSVPLAGKQEYTHYARPFELPTLRGQARLFLDPEWVACPECHRLIEAGDAPELLDRAVEGHRKLHPEMPRDLLRAVVAVPQSGFWKNIDPDRPAHPGGPMKEEQ